MAHEEFEEAVPLYAIGTLDRQERQAVEVHLLTGCTACHAALRQYQAVAGLLPYALPPAAPPPELQSKLLAALHQEQPQAETTKPTAVRATRPVEAPVPARQPAKRGRPSLPLAALLVVVLAGTAGYAIHLQSHLDAERTARQRIDSELGQQSAQVAALRRQVGQQEEALARLRGESSARAGDLGDLRDALIRSEVERDQLRADLVEREKEMAGLHRALAQRDEMLAFLRSPNVRTVTLEPLPPARGAGALVLCDPQSRKAFLYAFNLPPVPPGKTYQLWAILGGAARAAVAPGPTAGMLGGGSPLSAGVFIPDAGQKSRLVLRALPELSRITKFAVSLEPEGGQPQPTGELYLAGAL